MKLRPTFLAGLGVLGALIAAPAFPAHASSAQTLLNRAVRDTNTVHTLLYTSKSVQTTNNQSITVTIQGAEDEVANRERDSESVTAIGRTQQGAKRTVHYTVDIIFMGGKTYYRDSLQKNTWQTRNGMSFKDSATGITWQRGRTKVGDDWTKPLKLVGSVTNNGAQFTGRTSKATGQMPLQVWVSGGATPYVTREVITTTTTAQGQRVHYTMQQTFGPFNQPISIAQPATGST